MPDQNDTKPTAPVVLAANPATPAVATPDTQPATPAAPAIPADATGENPAWLPGRLAQNEKATRTKLLAELGVSDLADVKKGLQELDTLKTSQLSEREKLEKQISELAPRAARASQLEAQFATMVEAQFGALPDQAQSATDAAANGDAAKRWELMQVLGAAGSLATIPQTFIPATTAPAAPAPPTSTQPQTVAQRHAEMQKRDPIGASLFGRVNRSAIEASKV